jgi:hypothetical protein
MGNKISLRNLYLRNVIIGKLFLKTPVIQCYNTSASLYAN